MNAPQEPAWWFLAGDAIHKATEDMDCGAEDTPWEMFNHHFTIAIAAADETGIPRSQWKAGGRATKDFPNKEDESYWRMHGPTMVANWVQWRDSLFTRGWQFYTLDNGRPAIEVPIELAFDDVTVKGYIDRVFVNDNGEAVVVDLKSGSRVPASTLQLGVYALGMSEQHGITPILGGYYMTRQGNMPETHSLLKYTRERVGNWFASAKRGIEAEVFIPHVGPFCGTCSVAKYCSAMGGSDEGLANRLTSK
jgi:putative RecB family exonuclease